MKKKPPNTKEIMNLSDAINFLKEHDEHHTVLNETRETIIMWALFLKNYEEKKIKKNKKHKKGISSDK